jgi:hypothetical protein
MIDHNRGEESHLLKSQTEVIMFDEMWQEIQDMPGEIFDIPEMDDKEDFNLNDYLNSDYDY